MIPRYSTPEMTEVWSDTSKWARYLEVEVLATEAHAQIDVVPAAEIVGAHHLMHTVIQSECTGCELCVAPCPVDCISMRVLA